MERISQDPEHQKDLERALWQIDESKMLLFTPTGYRLFGYVDTDETQVHTVKTGESEYVFRLPVKRPIILKEASNAVDLIDDEYEYRPDTTDEVKHSIDDPEYKEWAEAQMTPKDLVVAAIQELDQRIAFGNEEKLPCQNCSGQAVFEVACTCTFGGVTFIDMVNAEEDSVTKLREHGVPDPGCGACAGSGKKTSDCPHCEGSGITAKYPTIILKNEMTGVVRELKLDIARLIVSGDAVIEESGDERDYLQGSKAAEKNLTIRLSPYIQKNLIEMGIDTQNSVRIVEDTIMKLQPEKADVFARRVWWKKQDDKVQKGYGYKQKRMTPDDVLEAAQRALSHSFSWPYGKTKDADGVFVSEEWVIRPLRPLHEALSDLRVAVERHGVHLGFTNSFIATGESGPAFYLVDDEGRALQQLSSDYYIRESLENAWLAFQRIQESL